MKTSRQLFTNLLLFAGLGLLASAAFAYTPPSDLIGQTVEASVTAISNNLMTIAVRLLFAFLLLQWIIDGYAMLAQGDITIEKVIGKFGFAILWGAFCLYLLADAGNGQTNLASFMQGTVDFFLAQAAKWAGAHGGSFDTASIMLIGLESYGKITLAVVKATATNAANLIAAVTLPQVTFITALMVFAISAVIVVSCAYIALKVFLVKVQATLFIALAPIAVAMLGLKALREQGIAPFKMLLGLVYRIIVLAVVVSTLRLVATNFANIINDESFGLIADIWTPLIASAFGFVLLAFIAHHADSIAASLANGNMALGSGDMASSVAAGVAAGLASTAGAAALMGKGAAGAASGYGTNSRLQGMANFFSPSDGKTDRNQLRNEVDSGIITPPHSAALAAGAGGSGNISTSAAAPAAAKAETSKAETSKAETSKAETSKAETAETSAPARTPPPASTYIDKKPLRPIQIEGGNLDRAAASAKRRAARSAAENTIGGVDDKRQALKQAGQHAERLNQELQHDAGADMGIRIDAFHRD